MLSDPKLIEHWNNCSAEPKSPILQKLIDVRNSYFAHWVPEVARSLIRRVADGEVDVPLIEWDQPTFISSRYTWAYAAIQVDLFEMKGQKIGIRPGELGKAIGFTAIVMEELIGRMCAERNLAFEPSNRE
jgi:hypothetical protein